MNLINKAKMIRKQYDSNLFDKFHINCYKCDGYCCVGLYFSKMDGFPKDKPAKVPCQYLKKDSLCKIHDELSSRHLKGCLGYDCMGAGQRLKQFVSPLHWYKHQEILDAFLTLFQIHQHLFYLTEASTLIDNPKINDLIQKVETLTYKDILHFDMITYHQEVATILKEITLKINHPSKTILTGKDCSHMDLSYVDLSMSFLIQTNLQHANLYGANFVGADMRDANIKDTDLSQCLFLTQGQINACIGNSKTILPCHLQRPSHW